MGLGKKISRWFQINNFIPEAKDRFTFRDFLLIRMIHRILPTILVASVYMFFLLFNGISQAITLSSELRLYLLGIIAVFCGLIFIVLLAFSFFDLPKIGKELELKHYILFYSGFSSLAIIVSLLHWFTPYISFYCSPFGIAIIVLFIALPLSSSISLLYILGMIIVALSGVPAISITNLQNNHFSNLFALGIFAWVISRLSYRELLLSFLDNQEFQIKLDQLNNELKQKHQFDINQKKAFHRLERELADQLNENSTLREKLEYETQHRQQEMRHWFEKQQQELKLLLDNSGSAVVLLDQDFKIKRYNISFEKLVKLFGIRILHPDISFLQLFSKNERSFWQEQLKEAIQKKSVQTLNEINTSVGKRMYHTDINMIVPFLNQEEKWLILSLTDNTENCFNKQLLQAVTDLSSTINSALDLNDLCGKVHQTIKQLIPANSFYIALYNDVRDVLSFPYVVDKYDTGGQVEHYDYWKPSKGITEFTFRRRKPLRLTRGELEDLIQSGEVELIGELPRFWLGIPLKDHSGEVFGVMVAQSYDDEEPYSERDLELATFISQQIGPAIQRFKTTELFQSLIQHVNEGILIIQEKQLVFYNLRFAELLGYSIEELRYLDIREIYTAEGYEILEKRNAILADGETPEAHYETSFKKKDGTIFFAEVNSSFITFLGIKGMFELVRDIKERLEREKAQQYLASQLRQKEKMDSIGLLAGGVAHEINNPLTGMINYAQLIETLSEDEELRRFAAGIINQGERVATVVKNLLNFSQQETKEMVPSTVEKLLESSLNLIQTLLQNDQIQIEVITEEGLPKIICNEQHLVQVFINFLLNSKDALNQKFEGYHPEKQIKVIARNQEEKEGIRIEFLDNGVGIPENIRQRIFDPFYTTKNFGQGTGLGLSAAYGILKEHNGSVEIESELGVYTRFILFLPYNPKNKK